MPFCKLIPPFTLTGWDGGVLQYIKKCKSSDLRHKATAKKYKITDCFIFSFLFSFIIFFWRLLKKKLQNLYSYPYFIIRILSSAFSHPHFPICILSSAFFHPHFIIRILSSAFCHPHFAIRILLSAIRHPPSAIRHPPSAAIRYLFYRDPTCLDRNHETSNLFSEMNQICYCKQNTLGRGKLLISHQDFIFLFKLKPFSFRKEQVPFKSFDLWDVYVR